MNRWDYSKSKSNYHFNPSKEEDSNPPFKILGNVNYNLEEEYKRISNEINAVPNGFHNRLEIQTNIKDKSFTSQLDEEELTFLGLKQDHTFFLNIKVIESPIIDKIADELGLLEFGSHFHIQRPGDSFPFHIDEIPGLKFNRANSWLDKNPHFAARFEIQVYDWQYGHVWAYGNTYWKQWKSGDISWHDWRNIPHGTCNIGRSNRITLQITGICSRKTIDIIKRGSVAESGLLHLS